MAYASVRKMCLSILCNCFIFQLSYKISLIIMMLCVVHRRYDIKNDSTKIFALVLRFLYTYNLQFVDIGILCPFNAIKNYDRLLVFIS